MYDHPEFVFMEIAARHELMRELAASRRQRAGTPLFARLLAALRSAHLRGAPRRREATSQRIDTAHPA